MTSHDVVKKVRRIVALKQVGHAGTLDPLAQGVLPIAVGSACRLLRFLPHHKVYKAEILLGRQTDTDDIEGKTVLEAALPAELDEQAAAKALACFTGDFEQVPPMYSAIHVEGKRLYELARAGEAPTQVKARPVTVYSIELISLKLPVITARISCGGGTYIRSIARDLGSNLGCGACLQALTREQSGPFTLDSCLTLQELDDLVSAPAAGHRHLKDCLIEASWALSANPELTVIQADQSVARALSCGQRVGIDRIPAVDASQLKELVLVTAPDGFLSVCRWDKTDLKPEVVIPGAQG